MGGQHVKSGARGLVAWAQTRLAERGDDEASRLGLAVLRRAEGIMERLDGVAVTLQKVANLELALAERLVPIVDDLGALVRESLQELREHRGVMPRRSAPVILAPEPIRKD
jgi:hypothetical protein